MHFLNESQIEHYVHLYQDHSILGPASALLLRFMRAVNEQSDGWAYWEPPVRAAGRLMTLIECPETATEANYKKALVPIKSFLTRHNAKQKDKHEAEFKFDINPPPEPVPAQKARVYRLVVCDSTDPKEIANGTMDLVVEGLRQAGIACYYEAGEDTVYDQEVTEEDEPVQKDVKP